MDSTPPAAITRECTKIVLLWKTAVRASPVMEQDRLIMKIVPRSAAQVPEHAMSTGLTAVTIAVFSMTTPLRPEFIPLTKGCTVTVTASLPETNLLNRSGRSPIPPSISATA